MLKRVLTIILVAFATSIVAPAAANASLSRVGPALSASPSKAKTQIESLVQHDNGVTTFVARQTMLSVSVIAQAEVVSVQKKTCIVGSSKTCGYNTGKDGNGNLRTTTFRKGTRVASYVATIEYAKGKTIKVTFLRPCSNVLGTRKVKHTKQRVSDKKAIVVKIAATSSATCVNGTASASVTVKTRVKSWSSFVKAIASATATCVPAPAGPPSAGPIVLTCTQMGLIESSPGSGVCQAQSASSDQDASVDNEIDCKVDSSPNACSPITIINQETTIIQVQGNCSKIIVTTGDGNQTVHYKDLQSGVSVNEEYCTVKEAPAPTTPQAPVDNPPHIDVFNTPAHLYTGGVHYVFIEAYDPDGDAVSVSTSASGQGTITLPTPVDVRWDNSPCPSGKSCYRARVQGSGTPGALSLTFKASSKDKFEIKQVTLPVVPDQF